MTLPTSLCTCLLLVAPEEPFHVPVFLLTFLLYVIPLPSYILMAAIMSHPLLFLFGSF